ncbi:hypothetical protein MPNT_110040 [Candidatus Methylacidithermus pantelleriae]|uniref:Uncharacterized protein n=1 Tax=Candidatus Methylacidithermus pantelleriae TaxID=2744239 RepID=A0A8J2BMY2_9BACT|nr:hypothetical protein MPNT_110040 [Candidatus Methylacidithermus pantelleriae]
MPEKTVDGFVQLEDEIFKKPCRRIPGARFGSSSGANPLWDLAGEA